jgi:chemotaxis protein histidine kinase CheA
MAKQQPIEIFMPPNMLKAKVGGSGNGGLDPSAIKRAEQAMDELKTDFTEWMNSDVEKLNTARDAYAGNPSEDTKRLIYRAAHDVKGQALTFEYPFAARVAASLCRLLDAHTLPPAKLVDAHVNAISVVVSRGIRDTTDAVSLALAQELEAQVSAILKAA